MKRYWSYFKSVVYHKYVVFIIGRMFGIPIVRLLLHDMSKFSHKEFAIYANALFDENGNSQYEDSDKFDLAWNHHLKHNKHHWEYWVIPPTTMVEIPNVLIREMVVDWIAAGICYTPFRSATDYYNDNQDSIMLSYVTERYTLFLLSKEAECLNMFSNKIKGVVV